MVYPLWPCRHLPDDQLFQLYGRVLCVPLSVNGLILMASLQIGPYTIHELAVSKALCPRWFPPPFAPPPTAPPVQRPTSVMNFEVGIAEGVANLTSADTAHAVAAAVYEVLLAYQIHSGVLYPHPHSGVTPPPSHLAGAPRLPDPQWCNPIRIVV